MRKSKEVELLKMKVTIFERNAQEAMDLGAFIEGKKLDRKLSNFVNASVLHDSLDYFIRDCNFWKRIKLKRLFSIRNLIKRLCESELLDYASEISDMEESSKKKVMESQSVEKLPKP